MVSNKQEGFIDIHSHILPFLDDGAKNYVKCLEAALCYHSAGFEQVIATPHFIPGTKWTPTPDQIFDKIKQAEALFKEHEIPLVIVPGMEIMFTDQICNNFDPDKYLSLGEKGYFLIEFPMNSELSGDVRKQLIWRLKEFKEFNFIIAHPERCQIFNNSGFLQLLVDQGMFTQLNINSLLGRHGVGVQQNAIKLLRAGLVHFLASDTHAKDGRMPPGKDTIDTLYELLGTETTNQAFIRNPKRLLAGKKVDPLIPSGNMENLEKLQLVKGGYLQKLKKIFMMPRKITQGGNIDQKANHLSG